MGFGSISTEYWLGRDAIELLVKYHAFVVRLELWSPDVDGGYMYADFDRFLAMNGIVMFQTRYTPKPHAVPSEENTILELISMDIKNPNKCGMKFGSGWLTYDYSASTCHVPMLSYGNGEMNWTLASGTSMRITKATVRIRPDTQFGKFFPGKSWYVSIYDLRNNIVMTLVMVKSARG